MVSNDHEPSFLQTLVKYLGKSYYGKVQKVKSNFITILSDNKELEVVFYKPKLENFKLFEKVKIFISDKSRAMVEKV